MLRETIINYKIIGANERLGMIEITGDLEVDTSARLMRVAKNLFGLGVTDLIIHLLETQFLSHVAVGVIASVSRSTHKRGGKLTILYDNPKVYDLLDNLDLAKYIDFPRDMDDALKKFNKSYHTNLSTIREMN